MIDMSNIFFFFFFFLSLQQFLQKVQNVNNNKMFTFWNELHTTDKFKKNYNIHVLIVSWFAICLHVHMHFLTWILWGYYSQPTHLINLILELEICLFRINKKNSILKYKCIVYSWHFIQIDRNYLEL